MNKLLHSPKTIGLVLILWAAFMCYVTGRWMVVMRIGEISF